MLETKPAFNVNGFQVEFATENGVKMVVSDSNVNFATILDGNRLVEFRNMQATLRRSEDEIREMAKRVVQSQEQMKWRLAIDDCLRLGIESMEWAISAEEQLGKYRIDPVGFKIYQQYFQDILETAYFMENLIETIDSDCDETPLQNLDKFHECLADIAAFVRSFDKTDLSPLLSFKERVAAYEIQQANSFRTFGTVRPSP